LASSLVLPLLLGIGADALLHSSPIGVVIGLFAGIVAAIALAVAQFKRFL
jgi:F0F1-type ATP synthase assembly protein I